MRTTLTMTTADIAALVVSFAVRRPQTDLAAEKASEHTVKHSPESQEIRRDGQYGDEDGKETEFCERRGRCCPIFRRLLCSSWSNLDSRGVCHVVEQSKRR